MVIVNDNREAYRVREFAEKHGVAERTVRRWIAQGTLEVWRIGRTVLIPAAELHRRRHDAA